MSIRFLEIELIPIEKIGCHCTKVHKVEFKN